VNEPGVDPAADGEPPSDAMSEPAADPDSAARGGPSDHQLAWEIAYSVYGSNSQAIERYAQILRDRAVAWGLLGPSETERIWSRHILNSAALAELIPVGSTVVDIGSGAGLPGVPLAILRPDLTVTLLEPLLRRWTFLTEVVTELDLGERVTAIRGRAEDHSGRYDVVVARAVARLDRLIPWCDPLRRPSGMILGLKGESAEAELTEAAKALAARGLKAELLVVHAHPAADPARVVRILDASRDQRLPP
jgi:16S rRNA (guanine527-N7)-methyltransferase